ncbi:Ferritin light chain [Camelus dromedarius]|uniref:Ferritin light chain n=1 Tax=Camelus dromedarius TaxID=9838 RepID=A0A5N4E3N2_CAMDR|nr:Ferritin light chain [Camelus dromedarius]
MFPHPVWLHTAPDRGWSGSCIPGLYSKNLQECSGPLIIPPGQSCHHPPGQPAAMGFPYLSLSPGFYSHCRSTASHELVEKCKVLFQDMQKLPQDEWGHSLGANEGALALGETLNQGLLNLHALGPSERLALKHDWTPWPPDFCLRGSLLHSQPCSSSCSSPSSSTLVHVTPESQSLKTAGRRRKEPST